MIPFDKIAIVTWIDATTFDGLREHKGMCPMRISVGFVVKDDALDISLCHLYDKIEQVSVNRDDERRVFYVGMTRAKENLFIIPSTSQYEFEEILR